MRVEWSTAANGEPLVTLTLDGRSVTGPGWMLAKASQLQAASEGQAIPVAGEGVKFPLLGDWQV